MAALLSVSGEHSTLLQVCRAAFMFITERIAKLFEERADRPLGNQKSREETLLLRDLAQVR